MQRVEGQLRDSVQRNLVDSEHIASTNASTIASTNASTNTSAFRWLHIEHGVQLQPCRDRRRWDMRRTNIGRVHDRRTRA
jgi:hypothetical protein